MTTTRSELLTLTNADPRFYKLIGPFLGRREVHRAVGSAIYDDDDKTWLVIVTGRAVDGFIAYRPQRGVIIAESCYIARRDATGAEDPTVRMALVQNMIAATAPSPLRTTVPRTAANVYTDAGFAELPQQRAMKNYIELTRSTS